MIEVKKHKVLLVTSILMRRHDTQLFHKSEAEAS